jgi:hypothetical protein
MQHNNSDILLTGEFEYRDQLCFGVVSLNGIRVYQTISNDGTKPSPTPVITYWKKDQYHIKYNAALLCDIDLRDGTIVRFGHQSQHNVLVLHDARVFHHLHLLDNYSTWYNTINKVVAWNHNLKLTVPDEILLHILEFMNAKELCLKLSVTCSHIHNLCYSDLLWNNLYKSKWPLSQHSNNIQYYQQLLDMEQLEWSQLFQYRYTNEKCVYKKKQLEMNESRGTDCGDDNDEEEEDVESNDLIQYELLNDDAIQLCEMADAIRLPELSQQEREQLLIDGKDNRQLPQHLHFRKQLLNLLAANVFEENYTRDYSKVYMLKNYSIMIRRLTTSYNNTTTTEQYLKNKLNHIIEKFELVLNNSKLDIKFRNEALDSYIVMIISIVMDFESNTLKNEYLEMAQHIADKYITDKNDLCYKMLKANLLGKCAKIESNIDNQLLLYDHAIQLLEQARSITINSSIVCGLGNMIFDQLNLLLKCYHQQTFDHFIPSIISNFTKVNTIYEQLSSVHRCEGLSYYNRACLHAICHGTNLLDNIDHDNEAKNYLEQTLQSGYSMASMDEDPDFDLVRKLPWFKDIRNRVHIENMNNNKSRTSGTTTATKEQFIVVDNCSYEFVDV